MRQSERKWVSVINVLDNFIIKVSKKLKENGKMKWAQERRRSKKIF